MNDRNSKVILSTKIKIDKNYNNVLSYNTEQMLALMQNQEHLVYVSNTNSFTKPDQNYLNIEIPYGQALKCNYMAFTNPDYSNKWFFVFIENIEYMSDKVTKIYFKIDAWTTWFDYWDPAEAYVIREHVTDDTIGKNTYPESLETGEYISHAMDKTYFGIKGCHPVVALTEDPFKGETNYPCQYINGVPTGLHYFVAGGWETSSVNFIGWVTNWAISEKKDLSVINSIFMVPDSMTGYGKGEGYWKYAIPGNLSYAAYHKLPEQQFGAFKMDNLIINKPYQNIDGYVPKNNKLFCYPYQYLMVDNSGGSAHEYIIEDFKDKIEFETKGAITPGCSIKTYPVNYKNVLHNRTEGLNGVKLPVGSLNGDVFTNWLTQNGVNKSVITAAERVMNFGNIGEFVKNVSAGMGVASKVAGMIDNPIVNVAASVGNTMHEVYQHSRIPNVVVGNTNSGDVVYADGTANFAAYIMTIKKEYAIKIDEYFSRFGYKVCEVKKPNIKTRPVFNFVQIAEGETLGYYNNNGAFPTSYMDTINSIARNGVTIWHDHANIGNYSLNNK